MISVKTACGNGWFHDADANELLQLANELLGRFCMNISITTEVSNAVNTISKIVPRFLPQLKLDCLIVSFDAKPGYDILLADFLIQKPVSTEETTWLFIARSDDLQTSSCLISPPSVSFLVNGKGVAGRTNVSLNNGPQLPTDITKLLNSGTNIIQAVGYFDGNYVIAVASMSKVTSIGPILKDYVQPVVAELVPDSEIIEGPSRISLNCPISFMRIKTPVKGHLCKHHQCFDYGNFVEMNLRKPSWHCPCCNQPTSFLDLCIDGNMVKILQDVTVDITDVFICPDGSWRVAVECNRSTDQLHDGIHGKQQDNKISGGDHNNIPNAVANILDITMDGDDRSENFTFETNDRKLFLKVQGVPESSAEQPLTHLETGITEGVTNQLGDNIWSSTLSLASTSNASSVSTMLDTRRVETLASMVNNIILNPVMTDATSPVLGQEPTASLAANQPASTFQSVSQFRGFIMGTPLTSIQTPASSLSQCRHPVLPDSGSNIDNGTRSAIVNGSLSAPYQAVPSATVITDELNTNSGDIEMQMVTGASDMFSALPQLHSMTQNMDICHRVNSAFQQALQLPPSMHAGSNIPAYHLRAASHRDSLLPPSDHQSSHHQFLNLSRHQTMNFQHASQNASHGPGRSSLLYHQHQLLAAQRISQLSRQQSARPFEPRAGSPMLIAADTLRPISPAAIVQMQNMVGGSPNVSRTEGLPGLQSKNNWRPTGRMRGSLTGGAYSSAIEHYLPQTSQQAPVRPPISSAFPTTDQCQ